MGAFCGKLAGKFKPKQKSEDKPRNRTQTNPNDNMRESRKISMSEVEKVIMQLKIQKDRIFFRIKDLGKKEQIQHDKIVKLMSEKQKDQAKYELTKKKRFHETAEQYRNKLSFIEEKIFTIEQAEENAAFTDLLRDSNKVLKDLNSKIDMEEIETAKMLQEETKMNQAQFNQLAQDEDFDQDIEDEYAKMEAEYMKGQ